MRMSSAEDERGSSSQGRSRQAQAIVTFASVALQQLASLPSAGSGSSSALLALLLDVVVAKDEGLTEGSMDQLSNTAREAVAHALRVMPAKDFVSGVLTVLNSGQPQVR